jgi:cysteine desulfurase family protein (TIGR01976 family)
MSFDPAAVRAQFPALGLIDNGRQAVFFDGPGGTQVPQSVADAMAHTLIHANANVHGPFLTSHRADQIIADAHSAMADMLGCAADEVYFGQNMTSLTFALSRAIGRTLQPGDEIVVTKLDHDANHAPWKALSELGVIIKEVAVDVEDCTLDMEDFAAKIGPKTKLVACGYASNAVGTINDVRKVVEMAHAVGALVFIDAVAYAPHGPIDVKALDCDFLACSVYKFFGPHTGVVYGKREHLERLTPYKVRPASNAGPDRWMTGTQSHESLAGTIAAVDYIASLGGAEGSRREQIVRGMQSVAEYELELCQSMIERLLVIPGLTFFGIPTAEPGTPRVPTIAFRLDGYTPQAVAEHLAGRAIYVWYGNYYALNLTESLGVEDKGGMVRVGLTHYNTYEEVDRLIAAINELVA